MASKPGHFRERVRRLATSRGKIRMTFIVPLKESGEGKDAKVFCMTHMVCLAGADIK